MTPTEISLAFGLAALFVERVSSHLRRGSDTESLVRKLVESLVADLRREHAECRKELEWIRGILSDITPQEPAE